MDTSTAPWTPLTGLSATITIQEVDAPYTVVVNDEPMTEMWGGNYIYIFTAMSLSKEYTYTMNPWATAFIESGVTNNTLYQWIQENRWWWGGGFSINYQAINSHTTSKVNELKEELDKKIKKIPQVSLEKVENQLSENHSQYLLATSSIIDRIDSSETEICSDIVRKTKELKEDNVKTRELVRQKTKKLDENVSKLADRQDLTDKTIEDEANEIEASLEKFYQEEWNAIEKELEDQYKKEADQIESEINS